MLKESENPPLEWPKDTSIREFSGIWWVAHTRSRNEKALAWEMSRDQIHYFLPMTRKVTKKSGRTIRSLLPLFTGYIFFCASEEQRIEVLKTNRVANLIEVSDQAGLMENLAPIQTILQQGQPVQQHSYIEAGQKCRVLGGPLMGTEGIVEKVGDTMRLVLQVEMLGQATSVEIAADMIELIDS